MKVLTVLRQLLIVSLIVVFMGYTVARASETPEPPELPAMTDMHIDCPGHDAGAGSDRDKGGCGFQMACCHVLPVMPQAFPIVMRTHISEFMNIDWLAYPEPSPESPPPKTV